jgi:hypothetical protein
MEKQQWHCNVGSLSCCAARTERDTADCNKFVASGDPSPTDLPALVLLPSPSSLLPVTTRKEFFLRPPSSPRRLLTCVLRSRTKWGKRKSERKQNTLILYTLIYYKTEGMVFASQLLGWWLGGARASASQKERESGGAEEKAPFFQFQASSQLWPPLLLLPPCAPWVPVASRIGAPLRPRDPRRFQEAWLRSEE